MIDLERLFRRLDGASFAQRGQLAAEAAAEAAPDDLDRALVGLAHAQPSVRLGVIELLRRAGHRGAIAALHAHARGRDGDDRIFALQALAELVTDDDPAMRADAAAWARGPDPFVAAQAARLLTALGPAPGAPRSALVRDAEALFAATRTRERVEHLAAIEARGPAAIAAVARPALTRGPADLAALVARALIRHADHLTERDALVPLLVAALRRVGDQPAVAAALDDAVLALGGVAHLASLLPRLDQLGPPTVAAVATLLEAQPAAAIAPHAPALCAALARRPALWTTLGPALAIAAPALPSRHTDLLRACADRVIAELRADRQPGPIAVVSVARVLATTARPGEVLAVQLVRALEAIAAPAAAQALAALCGRLATEAAAETLLAMTHAPSSEARAAATAAIAAWSSPWLELTAGPPPTLTPRYRAADGTALVRADRRLIAGEVEYALDAVGVPVRVDATGYGACLCCAPPRALVRPRAGLRCPATWVAYLRDGAQVIREDAHPHGRCARCDSDRPRVREGARTVCLACGAGRDVAVTPGAVDTPTESPSSLATPPTAAELAAMTPPIAAAMTASVVIDSRDGDKSYTGSGILIARDGDHVAILTNRHVVESDDRARLCALEAQAVIGPLLEARTVWRAHGGVDLALVEARIATPAPLAVMPLGDGAAHLGARVFAIGNPLGLPWSYTDGTLSATRDWTTASGLPVRLIQTDASIAPGSSGGGLWHADGRLLGVIAFGHQAAHGSPIPFAISVAAVRAAFARDDVRWRGQRLVDLA